MKARFAVLNHYHVSLFAYFLENLMLFPMVKARS